jgi:NAD(P)-dependent dehydrogenase (short-subunit alcohol dehydrogenase family)
MTTTPFRYDGQRVIVTGAASGMGAATAEMLAAGGAEVYGLDVQDVTGPVAKAVHCDCGDPAAIDAAVESIGGPVHALFNVAGVPQTLPPDTVIKVNFLGLRHLTERVLPLIPEGGAVAHVASIAGSGWPQRLDTVKELVTTPDFAAGAAWCDARLADLGDPYFFSKECVIVYMMLRAHQTVRRGVRMNCISPGPVDSPMMPDFRKALGDTMLDWTAAQANGRMGRPAEMAPPLVFLNSREASYVNGANLICDAGFTGGMLTGQVDFSSLG